jgi:hypothetical protein
MTKRSSRRKWCRTPRLKMTSSRPRKLSNSKVKTVDLVETARHRLAMEMLWSDLHLRLDVGVDVDEHFTSSIPRPHRAALTMFAILI